MDTFLGIFPAVVEARQAVGFEVVGAWMIPEDNQFIWIVGQDLAVAFGMLDDAVANLVSEV